MLEVVILFSCQNYWFEMVRTGQVLWIQILKENKVSKYPNYYGHQILLFIRVKFLVFSGGVQDVWPPFFFHSHELWFIWISNDAVFHEKPVHWQEYPKKTCSISFPYQASHSLFESSFLNLWSWFEGLFRARLSILSSETESRSNANIVQGMITKITQKKIYLTLRFKVNSFQWLHDIDLRCNNFCLFQNSRPLW